jgi:hypothetical protein
MAFLSKRPTSVTLARQTMSTFARRNIAGFQKARLTKIGLERRKDIQTIARLRETWRAFPLICELLRAGCRMR